MSTGKEKIAALSPASRDLFDRLCEAFDTYLEEGIQAQQGAGPVAIAEAVHLFAERTYWSLEEALKDLQRSARREETR